MSDRDVLRKAIDESVESVYYAGAVWALIQSGVEPDKAEEQVAAWRQQDPPPLDDHKLASGDRVGRAFIEIISRTP